MLAHLGIEIKLKLKQWGFYPKGGGEVGVKIYPTKTLKGKKWLTPPSFSHLKTISSSLGLAQHIKKRQTRTLLDFLNKLGLKSDVLEIEAIGRGQGSFLFLWVNEEIKAGFSALGAKGKPAEQVAKEVFNDFLSYYKTKPCLENHLADQIVPYLALAEEKSQFSTIISSHLLTNIWVINKFLNGKITYKGQLGHLGRVCIN
jgi:RNA 3'-phosphate cyclase